MALRPLRPNAPSRDSAGAFATQPADDGSPDAED